MKDFLTSLVPWYYRIAAIAIALAVSYSAGWMQAHSDAEEKADAVAQALNAANDVSKARLALNVSRQRDISKSTGVEYEAALRHIHDFYTDCLRRNNCPGQVPAVPGNTAPACARPADNTAIARLREDCAVTTQMFLSLRKAWQQNRDAHQAIYGE